MPDFFPVTFSAKSVIRSCLPQPHLWVLIGTAMPPLNVLGAVIFWIVAKIRRKDRVADCASCLNVQLTYTLLLSMPLIMGARLTKIPGLEEEFAPGSTHALIAGVVLGLIGALAVLLLVFFNTRALAERVLQRGISTIPRLRFFRETPPQSKVP